jgi:hypothetical protein
LVRLPLLGISGMRRAPGRCGSVGGISWGCIWRVAAWRSSGADEPLRGGDDASAGAALWTGEVAEGVRQGAGIERVVAEEVW